MAERPGLTFTRSVDRRRAGKQIATPVARQTQIGEIETCYRLVEDDLDGTDACVARVGRDGRDADSRSHIIEGSTKLRRGCFVVAYRILRHICGNVSGNQALARRRQLKRVARAAVCS